MLHSHNHAINKPWLGKDWKGQELSGRACARLLGAEAARPGAGRRAARAAAFLRDEVALLLGGGGESELEGRHAEALSSLVRRELKSLLNETVAIVHGTGSVRFNFDDPAALLHRALRALHDGGGPAWATELRAARCAAGGPLAFDGEDEAKDVLSLAAAHGFALSVFTQSAVRAKLASGGFDRLEALAGRVRGADAPWAADAPGDDAAAPASEAVTQVDAEAEAEAPAAPAAAAPLSPGGGDAAAPAGLFSPVGGGAAPAGAPKTPAAGPLAPLGPGPGGASPRPAATPRTPMESATARLACLAPLRDARALRGALLAAAPAAHASAADAIAHLTALRDAAAAAAAAAGSKKKRKKRKRDKQKPLFDDLANSGVFLFPEIAAFPAEAD